MDLNVWKADFWAWYNEKIVAEWYKSAALIGGWLTSLVLFLPNLLQFIFDHWDLFGGMLLPKFDPTTQAIVLAVYVTFIAPPLRAWVQTTMEKAAIKQQSMQGKVVPLPASGVRLSPAPAPSHDDFVDTVPDVDPADVERLKLDPGPQ